MIYKVSSIFYCAAVAIQCLAAVESSSVTLEQNGSFSLIGLENFSQEDLDYINVFPLSQYTIHNVQGQGLFFLDNIDDCIKNVLRSGTPWEASADEVIRKYAKPNTIALDIGAHIGTHTLAMSQAIGRNGVVIAFEPQRKIFRELVMNLRLNQCTNVFVQHCALGAENKISYLSSPLADNEGARFIATKTAEEKIQMKTLDSFQIPNISFIKMDVENYEDAVLAGAKQTILRCKPVILIEIEGNFVQASQVSRNGVKHMRRKTKRVIATLEKLGYDVQLFNCCDYLAIPKK